MWIAFAIGASILWGLTYVIDEQIFKSISVVTSLAIACLVTSLIMFLVAYMTTSLKSDLMTIISSKKLAFLVILGIITFTLAELFIGLSISSKNATLSGLIEISYPFFIVFFARIIFNENQISVTTLIAGFLIFSGIFIIFYFNK